MTIKGKPTDMPEVKRAKELIEEKAEARHFADRRAAAVGYLLMVLFLIVGVIALAAQVSNNSDEIDTLKTEVKEVPVLRAQVASLQQENLVLRSNLDRLEQQLIGAGLNPDVNFPPGFTTAPTAAPTTTTSTTAQGRKVPIATTASGRPTTTSTATTVRPTTTTSLPASSTTSSSTSTTSRVCGIVHVSIPPCG